ncbi:MAG: carboxylating nicotinate-nucleotide diphosphorylase [Acidiferrobacteraceae bacterium]
MVDSCVIKEMVASALAEDIGAGDVSADIIPKDLHVNAVLITREDAVLCGTQWVEEVFRVLDAQVSLKWRHQDGDTVHAGHELCVLEGPAHALLTGERVALNFLQTLSGTATRTRRYVDQVRDTGARILDTRKTIPGWRLAQKYAVTCGGGVNHRMGLFDAMLLKENHIAAAGSIRAAVATARAVHSGLLLEVEVEHLSQLDEVLASGVDRILLDNFAIEEIRAAVRVIAGRCPIEVSGGVTLENVRAVAKTGVSFISIGDITKNVIALDLSVRFR